MSHVTLSNHSEQSDAALQLFDKCEAALQTFLQAASLVVKDSVKSVPLTVQQRHSSISSSGQASAHMLLYTQVSA